jgi:hypothetical protein
MSPAVPPFVERDPNGPYTAEAMPIGWAVTDGDYELTKLADGQWLFREPSEDHPGYGEYELDNIQAQDVMDSIFPPD